jgi:hypothetical protein
MVQRGMENEMKTVHYVGMNWDTYLRARRVWGGPAYYHKWMDDRVWTEVGDDDVVIIGTPKYNKYAWDASAVPMEYTS